MMRKMTDRTFRHYLDYVPFLFLCVLEIVAACRYLSADISPVGTYYTEMAALACTAYCFYRKHALGVLATGLTLMAGIWGLVSYSVTHTVLSFTFGWKVAGNATIGTPGIHPYFLLYLLVHLFISGKYYVGVLSREYWQKLKSEK